jgi:hypothetical protein
LARTMARLWVIRPTTTQHAFPPIMVRKPMREWLPRR